MVAEPTSKVVGTKKSAMSKQSATQGTNTPEQIRTSNVITYDEEQLLWSDDEELDDVTSVYSNGKSFTAYSSAPRRPEKSLWLLDTGASQHMCNDITCFRTFKKWSAQVDFGGEDTDGNVHGSGDVLLRLRSHNNDRPRHLLLKNVLYIPTLRKNLICSYSLGENGIDVAIRKNHSYLLKDG
ncbi:hypothetical protein V1509DRAFT_643805, partial [Lipomyces kononenkoae]